MIGIEYEPARSTAPEVPTIYLTNIHARLTAITDCRVPHEALFNNRGGNDTPRYEEKIDIVNQSFNMPMYNHMQLDELIGGLRTLPNLPPSFKSYNISRHYILIVTAVVTCAQLDFKLYLSFGLGGREFRVMSRVFKSVVVDAMLQDLNLNLAPVQQLEMEYEEEELPHIEERDSGRTVVPGYDTAIATPEE